MAKANGKGGAQPTAKFMPHQRLAQIRNAQQLLVTTRPPEALDHLGLRRECYATLERDLVGIISEFI